MPPDINTFVIRSETPEVVFRAFFGDGAALVVDGYGGWSVVNRAKDVGITEWVGRNPIAIEIPFVIDNWMSREDERGIRTEQMCGRLERLCGLGTHEEPPVVSVHGHGAIPHDEANSPSRKWVVENVVWDRAMELRSGTTQRRLRCGGTIMLRQFIESDPLERLKKKKKKKAKGGKRGKNKFYLIKEGIPNSVKGESLTKVAGKVYGDASKWKQIAEANDIRDPRNTQVGQRVRIP